MASAGGRVREVREKRRLTLEKLAEKTGLSKGFLSDVENGNSDISSDNLLKVADVLNANLEYLLRGEASPSSSREPVIIPSELSLFAEQEGLSYTQTLELLEAHNSIIARRSGTSQRSFGVDHWRQLHRAIQKTYGAS
jgi:transcriptional regulator with XRE-family HTH domain